MADINDTQLNIPPDATDEEKAKAYSAYFALPFIHLKDKTVSLEVLSKIPLEVTSNFGIVAYGFDQEKKPPILKIAVADPSRLQKKAPAILSELKKEKGINIELAITTQEDFDFLLNNYKKMSKEEKPSAKSSTGYPIVDLKEKPIPYDVLSKFPEEVASRYRIVVFEAPEEDKIKVAVVNPDDAKIREILDFIKERNKIEIEVYQTSPQSLDWALRGYRHKPTIPLAKPLPPISEPPRPPAAGPVVAKPEEKEEKPRPVPLERIREEKPFPKPEEGKAPEIKIEEVKSPELRQGVGARESTIQIEPVQEETEKNLDKLLPQGIKSIEELQRIIKAGFIPKTLAAIIYLAVLKEASDIHLEGDGKTFKLRYRIDGLLRDILRIPLELQAPLISRIKILAKLKIDETRIPQDGRFEVLLKDRDIDLRVSTLPTVHGEKAVLRILDKTSRVMNLKDLGVAGRAFKVLEENIKKPYGVILATGPTGSGKTTTLYAVINQINKPEVNIITLEDPVEYEISGINQCQIKPKIGFGFADGLRSILRQDPNIIMVGEIRDNETANLATHAALTGHLVLSTLHTNDAASGLPRLINMGVEPFLITSAINCIIAQRLVRKICSQCKEEYRVPEAVKEKIEQEIDKSQNKDFSTYKNKPLKFYHGKGCSSCNEGFRGRIGVFEILQMSEKIEELAVSRAPATSIREVAIKEGMLTMKEDGIIKALAGVTTIDEILRVSSE